MLLAVALAPASRSASSAAAGRLTVPILVYALGVRTKAAIALSLLVVGVTSLAAMLLHARAGDVDWRTGFLFGVVGMVGAYIGGLVSQWVPGPVLLFAFAAVMIAAGVAMLRAAAGFAGHIAHVDITPDRLWPATGAPRPAPTRVTRTRATPAPAPTRGPPTP